jgi:hypothetical protein
MSKKENQISEEIAVEEVLDFVNYYSKKPIKLEEVKEQYLSTVEAVQSGNLVFEGDAKKPKYTLVHILKNEEGGIYMDGIEFKTRIKPTTKADLAKGLDLQKDLANYSLRCISHIIGTTVKELDKFEPIDYDVISEVSAVFMAGGR